METQSDIVAAIAGINSAGAGVYAECRGKGPGMFSKSQNWEGVHGETQSDVAAAIGAFQLNPNGTGPGLYAESHGKGAGVIGFSKIGEGVHGDSQNEKLIPATAAQNCAAVAGINSSGAGVYGESRGKGAGVIGKSQNADGM